MAFQNIYHHRKVANTASKPCEICFKPSTSVMTTPENKDFFYVCPGHLKDNKFCTPIVDPAAVAARRKAEMEREVERVKREYEEKQRRKKEKEAEREAEKEKGKEKDSDKKGKKSEDDTKKPEVAKKDESPPIPSEEEPRVFALQKAFFQLRIEKKRSTEQAKRQRERFHNPNLFPEVPKGFP